LIDRSIIQSINQPQFNITTLTSQQPTETYTRNLAVAEIADHTFCLFRHPSCMSMTYGISTDS